MTLHITTHACWDAILLNSIFLEVLCYFEAVYSLIFRHELHWNWGKIIWLTMRSLSCWKKFKRFVS